MDPREPQTRINTAVGFCCWEWTSLSGYGLRSEKDGVAAIRSQRRGSHPRLRALLKGASVGYRNTPLYHTNPPGILKIFHGARHRFAARSDHVSNGLVR
jgi:hypothetical protein